MERDDEPRHTNTINVREINYCFYMRHINTINVREINIVSTDGKRC